MRRKPDLTWHRTLAGPLVLLLLASLAPPAGAQEPDPKTGPEDSVAVEGTPAPTPQDGDTLQDSDTLQETAKLRPIRDPGLYAKTVEAAYQAMEYYGADEDPEALQRINEIGYRLAAQSDFDEVPFTFHLVDMPVPNAFALPGGQIFVTRGMLNLGLDDDMLANLLGHELAHVVHRHGTRMQKRAALLNMLSTAVIVGVAVAADNSRSKPTGTPRDPYELYGIRAPGSGNGSMVEGAAAASLVLGQLLLLNYSREFETEADDEGQRLAAAAGFDPQGAQRLWETMILRVPVNKTYGYWRTHPFEDARMRAAETRAELLKILEPESADELRRATQATILANLDVAPKKPEIRPWLEETALEAWPRGPAADDIRLTQLHSLREEELDGKPLARDYGSLIEAYRRELEVVAQDNPESSFLATARAELAALEEQRGEVYAQAQEVLAGGVWETAFLETFLSNFPDAPESPAAALSLGDAYSRLQRPSDAVGQYLGVWRRAPESLEGMRALNGLKNLAPYLEDLTALQKLAQVETGSAGEAELQTVATERLEQLAGKYTEIENGAAYLEGFPSGAYAEKVTERLHVLADNLYTEVIVYQGVGDNVKALDRINRILTFAPLSPAAERLRDQTVVES